MSFNALPRFAGLALLLLGFLALPSAWADEPPIWLILAERGGVYGDAAGMLVAELSRDPRHPELVSTALPELPEATPRIPQLIVTIGTGAFRALVERVRQDTALARVPILATLLPQSAYESLAARTPVVSSAVFLDQPAERYLDLVRLTMPERSRVGIVLGPDSVAWRAPLTRAATARGMTLVAAVAQNPPDDLHVALGAALEETKVLISLPDRQVNNAATLQHILMTSYRQRIPVVSFSEAQLRAGATIALYTAPKQAAAQAAVTIHGYLASRQLPPPKLASDFSVLVNGEVARSLGLVLEDGNKIAAALRRREEGR